MPESIFLQTFLITSDFNHFFNRQSPLSSMIIVYNWNLAGNLLIIYLNFELINIASKIILNITYTEALSCRKSQPCGSFVFQALNISFVVKASLYPLVKQITIVFYFELQNCIVIIVYCMLNNFSILLMGILSLKLVIMFSRAQTQIMASHLNVNEFLIQTYS